MSKIRAVIFDFYNTLVDIWTNEGKEEIFDRLSTYLKYYGANTNGGKLKIALELEYKRCVAVTGERHPDIDLEIVFANVLKKEGLDNAFLAESSCKLFRLLSRERFGLFPESLPVLKEMKRNGYPLAVISDAQKVFCLDEIRMLGLNGFFQFYALSTQFGFRKPDPRLFSIACALLDVPPAEAVYIGDNPETDVKGPHRVGMPVILVDRRQEHRDREPKPDFYADNLWEAWNWVNSRGLGVGG